MLILLQRPLTLPFIGPLFVVGLKCRLPVTVNDLIPQSRVFGGAGCEGGQRVPPGEELRAETIC